MIGKITTSIKALNLLRSQLYIFYPKEILKDKRVAILGAAATAFEEEKGNYIESFDIVVRINKALHSWRPSQERYIGKRTDILFHSFYENESSGGGPINYDEFVEQFHLQYLVHPDNSWKGYRTHLNFYKRHPQKIPSYILSRRMADELEKKFKNFSPTVGFSALYSVLNSPCAELYITGFTFFKTPYVQGYRDHLLSLEANDSHIKEQGLHNPELEFQLFKSELSKSSIKKISLDRGLNSIV